MKRKGSNGLIERIVENWLINTNEKGYQVPFCQCLVSQGYKVLHLSSHGQMEQGKDVISIDKEGTPCAFQLKGGNIDGTLFREIKGEIDELVEIAINFPGVRKDIPHRAVLVTNGTITDKVRRDIDDLNLNYKRRGFSQLEVRTKMDLLKDFLEVNGTFLPVELSDFKLFLELLLYDGHELVNKELFSKFIEKVLFTEKEGNPDLKRKIGSALLLTEYVLNPFEMVQNHISVIEGWTLFCSYMLAIVEKYTLELQYWKESYDLIQHKINSQLDLLKAEFLSRQNYFETAWDGGDIYRSRFVIVLGWLSSFELYQKQKNSSYVLDKQVYERIAKLDKENVLWYWGESATPFLIAMSLFVREYGDKSLSNKIVADLIALLADENTAEKNNVFPIPFADPYHSSEEILGSVYGVTEVDFNSFLGSSYHIGALVDIMVRRNERKFLDNYWKHISGLRKCEFIPSPAWKLFIWQCDDGEQKEVFYERPQSWTKLVKDAMDNDNSGLPRVLTNNPFSYYFLLCFPHRLGQKTTKLIDREFFSTEKVAEPTG
ncbi:MAG: hypothetical protein M1167_05040, partial [Chloroflexi bacterium]|nr:hypothetical protein [Chloroflexota bacterium]